MSWYLQVLQNYAGFGGRARRAEYWNFALFNFLIVLGLVIISRVVGLAQFPHRGPLVNLYQLAVLIPSIAVGIRRLHDIGKSGWWLLIAFVPVLGWIWLLILMIEDSQPGSNEFGANPKQVERAV